MKTTLFLIGCLALLMVLVDGCCSSGQESVDENSTIQLSKSPDLIQIYLKEFDLYFKPDSCQGNIEIQLLGDKGILIAKIENCKGKMTVKQFDNKGKLLVEGEYRESLDTLKKYTIGRSVVDTTRYISVLKYFQPLPIGVWKYYAEGGHKATEVFLPAQISQ